MSNAFENVFVAIALTLFIIAFGLQGLHGHRLPPAQTRTDLGPDTITDSQVGPSRG